MEVKKTSMEVAVPSKDNLLPRKRKPKILEEDEYVERLADIVERDYFPDLKLLRQQSDADNDPSESTSAKIDDKMTLDKFASKYTSEDNASFEQIMEDIKVREEKKIPWMYKDEAEANKIFDEHLALPAIDDQVAGTSSNNLITWPYKNMNTVMFNPDGIPQIEDKNKKLVVVKENTRFSENPYDKMVTRKAVRETSLAKQAAAFEGKIGPDGKLIEAPKVGDYAVVPMTPVIAPSTPLMTWGEIEGTPQRMETLTPLCRSVADGTPQFRIPATPSREALGLSLAGKVARKYRESSRKKQWEKTASIGRPGTSSMDVLSRMSPAAQRLAAEKFKLTPSSADSALRASYTPSIHRTPRTPSDYLKTPSKEDLERLTDNLLKLPKKT